MSPHFRQPHPPALSSRPHRGYTLIELLIAFAILAAIAGLTLPALRGPLDKSRLRSAAREIQTALARARAFAIRTGERHDFRYEIGGQAFRIETTAPRPEHRSESERLPEYESGRTASLADLATQAAPRTVREGRLPDGVVFAWNGPEGPSYGNMRAAPDAVVIAGRWSSPISFLPNGRSADTTIRVRGSRDFYIDVSLRGLTGIASHSAPDRLSATDPIQGGL
jgi:prepilin-type N-terminal cleavage/methylation domain-containing protein